VGEIAMESPEKKNVALKFCSLSSIDQRSILAQLPSDTKSKLLSLVESLDLNELSQPAAIEMTSARDPRPWSESDLQRSWQNFTYRIELQHAESGRELPKHLLRAMKELNQ
jgi:hypothetical protein